MASRRWGPTVAARWLLKRTDESARSCWGRHLACTLGSKHSGKETSGLKTAFGSLCCGKRSNVNAAVWPPIVPCVQPDVVTKYKAAAKIVNGAPCLNLCQPARTPAVDQTMCCCTTAASRGPHACKTVEHSMWCAHTTYADKPLSWLLPPQPLSRLSLMAASQAQRWWTCVRRETACSTSECLCSHMAAPPAGHPWALRAAAACAFCPYCCPMQLRAPAACLSLLLPLCLVSLCLCLL